MSNINLVIVPVWLNLIQKELGIADADLAVCEKISGILSPRDLLIYKMVNFLASDVLVMLGGPSMKQVGFDSMNTPLPTPTLIERATMANQDIATLVCGATVSGEGNQLVADVQLVDTELMVIRLMHLHNAPDNVKECGDSLATKITKVLHGRIPLNELARTNAFKQHVQDVKINPVFY